VPISDYVTRELDDVLHVVNTRPDWGSSRAAVMKLVGVVSVLARELDEAGKHRHAIVEKLTAAENRLASQSDTIQTVIGLANRLASAVHTANSDNASEHAGLNRQAADLSRKLDALSRRTASVSPKLGGDGPTTRPAGFGS
jgi:ABC-type transporter Mla subunit MlaD